jgi:MscS family membrane protein
MSTIIRSVLFGTAALRSIALVATLVAATLVLADIASAAQPTLKEVIGGKDKEKQVKEEPEKTAEQKPKPEQKKAQPAGPEDEFNRGTPRSSVQGFLKATGDRDYEKAAEYLDLRRLPSGLHKKEGPRLARELNIVFDRTLWIDIHDLSTDPKGRRDDGLPTYRDRVGRIKTERKTYDILLQRVPRKDNVRVWKFSSATVAQIPQLYGEFGYGFMGDILPAVFLDFEIFGINAWWWIALFALCFVAYFAALAIMKVVILFLRSRVTKLINPLERILTGPGMLILFVIIGRAGIDLLGPTPVIRALMSGHTLSTVAVAWGFIRFLDLFVVGLAERLRRRGRGDLTVLLQPVTNAAKVVVVLIAVIVWLSNVGFDVTTLMAGLGIGGLAVALAAQKPLENLIGAITLYSAQPVRIGEFCRFGNSIGTVEEIGLRATKVRTLDRTIVNIPNAEFANLHLDNFTKRDKIWYHPRISLRYETTPDQIRYILVEIRKMLYAHPKVDPDPARIRFVGYGTYSLDLDIFAYIKVTDYGEYLEVAEDLNLRIMDIVTNAGSSFAFPSQRTYLERGNKLNEQLAHDAEAHVREWKEQKALYLPNFPQKKIAELRGSLDYPPIGSPGAFDRG